MAMVSMVPAWHLSHRVVGWCCKSTTAMSSKRRHNDTRSHPAHFCRTHPAHFCHVHLLSMLFFACAGSVLLLCVFAGSVVYCTRSVMFVGTSLYVFPKTFWIKVTFRCVISNFMLWLSCHFNLQLMGGLTV